MFLLFLAFWIVLNGRISTELSVIGLVLAAALFAVLHFRFRYTPKRDLELLKKVPMMLRYLVQLVRDMILSTAKVLGYVYSAKYEPEPQVLELRIRFATDWGRTLMANYITLTPGTITVEAEGDRFVIHCLDPEFAPDPKGRMVRIIRRLEA